MKSGDTPRDREECPLPYTQQQKSAALALSTSGDIPRASEVCPHSQSAGHGACCYPDEEWGHTSRSEECPLPYAQQKGAALALGTSGDIPRASEVCPHSQSAGLGRVL